MSDATEYADFPTQFDPSSFEDAIYKRWEDSGVFTAQADPARKPYTIVIPPPNVTGVLHIGHALNNSLQDLLTRWRRMQGYAALWLPGTDHAGIATQNVVEKMLARTENKTRYDIGREKLIERIWTWREESGGIILKQLRKLGASCDWSRTRFTLDEGLSSAVREAFVRLFEQKLIYRGKYLVNWCPRCRTTLSDDEVNHTERNGRLTQIRYPIAGESGRYVTIATTRPETLLGDAAVAVSPKDARYDDLIGKRVKLPLTDRTIPIIADEAVEFEFGTGCLKVTPAHDPIDYDIGRRHNLELINILTEDGKLNDTVPEKYRGLDVKAARKAVLQDLEALELLGEAKDHVHQVGACYRCDTVIEPYLTSQWYVNMKPLSELAVAASVDNRVSFHPERWTKVYLQWFKEVRDWPISRQIWWGHQIPVWYCLEDNPSAIQKIEAGAHEPFDVEEDGKRFRYLIGENATPIVAREDPSSQPEYKGKTLIRDPDVLDTWFSSALWPFSTMGWPASSEDVKYFYPTDVLVTGRDIIYFWVARMVMMGEFLMHAEPFGHVYINATVLDGDGAVMSKSKGNSVDPLDIIRRYGADAMRFTLYDATTEGQDLRLPVTLVCPHCNDTQPLQAKRTSAVMACPKCKKDYQQPVPNEPPLSGDDAPPMAALDSIRFEKGRNFSNKLWNAARFVLTGMDDQAVQAIDAETVKNGLTDQDRWILSRLNETTGALTQALDRFEFSRATQILYQFFWDEFCAWTIELSKPRLAPDHDAADRAVATAVLLHVLDHSLRMLHPFCPFITEALWQELGKRAPRAEQRNLGQPAPQLAPDKRPFLNDLLAGAAWPAFEPKRVDHELEAQFASLFEAVRAVRNIRQKNGIGLKDKLTVLIRTENDQTAQRLAAQQHILEQMAGIEPPQIGPAVTKPSPAGTEVLDGAELYVALAGRIDLGKERARLEKEIERAEKGMAGSANKLKNDKFVNNAPPDKVAEERARLTEYEAKVTSLKAALKELG